MEVIPLDQYCAQQSKDGLEDGNILTADPNIVLQNASLKKPLERKSIGDNEGAGEKKMKEEEVEEGEVINDDASTSKVTSNQDDEEKDRKKKVALLLSYCGANYHGMQKNPDVVTIELKFFEALLKINAIREMHMKGYMDDNLNQLSFNRAARTDKGVSAARQVVSMKAVIKDDFITALNAELPKDIRCFGYERVTKGFDAKNSCSGRSYEYLAPSFAFAPDKNRMDSSYRISDEQLDLLNSLLKIYEGTHNFHNFTSGKHPLDKSAVRYITKCQAKKPFECRKHEFIAIEISGQSFMIHQIRKMIGMCIAICRGYCPRENMENAWENSKLDIPKAPGLGLLLDKVYFKKYNDKFGNDGIHNPLTWENCELDIERFKIEHIWESIIEEEIKKSSMVAWLKTLASHTYSTIGMNDAQESDYKGECGIFPPTKKTKYSGRKPWQYGKKKK